MKRWWIAAVLALVSALAFALPTVDAVQAEVRAGRYDQAESMMREVVAARPNSARAHYVLAEILAHQRHFDDAALHARRAREIDPKVGFADPAKFRDFEQLLAREQKAALSSLSNSTPSTGASANRPVVPAPARAVEPATVQGSGLPGWIWGIGAAAAALLLWRVLSARRATAARDPYGPVTASAGYGASGYGSQGFGAGPAGGYAGGGYGPAPVPARGSGLAGAGLAAAGGFAAGMLAEKLLDGHRESSPDSGAARAGSVGDLSALEPGRFDDGGAADALAQRSVDFGSGDGWGGDSGGSDSGDSGGGSDDW